MCSISTGYMSICMTKDLEHAIAVYESYEQLCFGLAPVQRLSRMQGTCFCKAS